MDVLPVVAKEVVTCYHARMTATAAAAAVQQGAAVQQANAAVTVEFATLLTRLWLLGADGVDAAGNVGDTAAHLEAEVHDMVEFLCTRCTVASVSTLSLQAQSVALQLSLRQRRAAAEAKHHAITQRLLRAIVERRTGTPEEVLGEVTLLILHRYGQLQANSDASLPAHKETTAVLCSVLPRKQVVAFMRQDGVSKTRALDELRRVVWGMRLYNKAEGKSASADLVDVRSLLVEPLALLEQQLSDELTRVQEDKLRRLLAVLLSPTAPLAAALRQQLREEYHHTLQVRHELLLLRCMLHAVASRAHTHLLPAYTNALTALQQQQQQSQSGVSDAARGDTAASSTSSPPSRRHAYPRYMELADAYQAIHKCSDELDDLRSLLHLCLRSEATYTSALPPHIAAEATAAAAARDARDAAVVVDRAALAAHVTAALASAADAHTDGDAAAALLRDYHVYYTTELPSTVDAVVAQHYPHLLCGLRGFCPVTYRRHGLLVAGRVDVHASSFPGFVVVEGGRGRTALPRPLCCAFAGVDELRSFAADPLTYLLPCVSRCNRAEPGVTVLFGLLERLPREVYIAGARHVTQLPASNVGDDTAAAATTDEVLLPTASRDAVGGGGSGSGARRGRAVDAGTQTTHPDPHHDHAYRWNEWDLRRQAVKLANLTHMRTHATQTAASHFRCDGAVQASPPRNASTQTMHDVAVQPPRVAQYVKGLRGSATSALEQVQRTFLY